MVENQFMLKVPASPLRLIKTGDSQGESQATQQMPCFPLLLGSSCRVRRYVPRIGRHGLVDLLQKWREAGLNHAALGVQMARRPAREVTQELAEEVLPLFAALPGPKPHVQVW